MSKRKAATLNYRIKIRRDSATLFTKGKTSVNVNSLLASMLNQAYTSPANIAFIKDI